MKNFEKSLVLFVLKLKSIFGVKTFVIESAFVLISLCSTAFFMGKEWQEWIAVFAVYFTFKHASVSNRMEEQEGLRASKGEKITVSCYKKSTHFFYAKEVLWFAYFSLSGSYSALAGVIVFLLYGWWRKAYRKHKPIA